MPRIGCSLSVSLSIIYYVGEIGENRSNSQSWTMKRDLNSHISRHVSRNGYRINTADRAKQIEKKYASLPKQHCDLQFPLNLALLSFLCLLKLYVKFLI